MNVQDIDLNLLRVFDAVLHERGVTPAAVRLGLTQPAVSNALARLRKLLGDDGYRNLAQWLLPPGREGGPGRPHGPGMPGVPHPSVPAAPPTLGANDPAAPATPAPDADDDDAQARVR